jgi:hypothetical protein
LLRNPKSKIYDEYKREHSSSHHEGLSSYGIIIVNPTTMGVSRGVRKRESIKVVEVSVVLKSIPTTPRLSEDGCHRSFDCSVGIGSS